MHARLSGRVLKQEASSASEFHSESSSSSEASLLALHRDVIDKIVIISFHLDVLVFQMSVLLAHILDDCPQ
eukprot:scaffold132159_cov50-Attheya_sp.AAC.4